MRDATRFASRWIGPALFLALIAYTDLPQVGEIWRRGSAAPLAAAAGLNAVIVLVKTWRWRRLMRLQGIRFGFAPAARQYAIGCALGAWTPGRLGDFSKALAVHRDRKVGLGRAASSVIADRLLDAAALAGVAALGAAFLPGGHGIWLLAAGLMGAAAAVWLLLRRARHGAGRRGAERIVGGLGVVKAAGDEASAALEGLVELARPALGSAAALTAAATLVTFVQGYLVARGLGMEVGFWTLSAALAAASIASLLPVSVAGIGTREATLLLFLGRGGLDQEQVIGFSLAYFVVVTGSLALMGAAAWMARPASSQRGAGPVPRTP